MIHRLPLGIASADLLAKASVIADRYGFEFDQHTLPRLELTHAGLVLLLDGFSPLQVDFSGPRHLDKQHGLIRACKPKPGMRILDVTGGWGRDATLLARCGAEVVVLERQPVMAALLADGLERLGSGPLQLSLIHADALDYLSGLTPEDYPDVIYIDPMHPERRKSALVKKDMQALQRLFGADADAQLLIATAIEKTRKKVVVKWPQGLPLLQPNESMPGKTVRFDIYRTDEKRRSLR